MDEATAAYLLGEGFTVEHIESGIVLATLRRMQAQMQEGASQGPVRSLRYFEAAIREVLTDPNMTVAYITNCRRGIARALANSKKPMGAVAG